MSSVSKELSLGAGMSPAKDGGCALGIRREGLSKHSAVNGYDWLRPSSAYNLLGSVRVDKDTVLMVFRDMILGSIYAKVNAVEE